MAAADLVLAATDLAGALPGCCPRCYWICYHCAIPYQMPFPGIFSIIDASTKQTVHRFFKRHHRLPRWYPKIGHVVSYLNNLSWEVRDDTGITLRGRPDDVFRLRDGSYHIVDYKTAKLTPLQDDLFPKWEIQLNCYAYMAARIGYSPISGLSLIYMEPTDIASAGAAVHTALRFVAKRLPVRLQPRRLIPPLLRRAYKTLSRPRPPQGTTGCEECAKLEELVRAIL